MYSLINVLLCVQQLHFSSYTCTKLYSQYIFCEGNLYLKNNPNYHKTCCKFTSRSYSVHQALSLKWCFSGNPDTLKVTDPQGGTGTVQGPVA